MSGAIVKREATDLPSLQAGQMVRVGRDGGVVAGRLHRRRVIGQVVLLGVVCAGLCVANPPLGLAVAGAIALTSATLVRWQRRVRGVLTLLLDDQLDAADLALDHLGTPWIARGRRLAHLAHLRSAIAERRPDLSRAVRCSDECLARLPYPARGYAIVYWQNQYNRAHWLIELGRVDDARAQLVRCGRAPGGEWYKQQYRYLVLHAAFGAGGELPDDDTLHDWLRDLLRYNHTGVHLALLGWALEQRGDADTAELAFTEAPSRFLKGTAMLERIFPRLWAAVGGKLAP